MTTTNGWQRKLVPTQLSVCLGGCTVGEGCLGLVGLKLAARLPNAATCVSYLLTIRSFTLFGSYEIIHFQSRGQSFHRHVAGPHLPEIKIPFAMTNVLSVYLRKYQSESFSHFSSTYVYLLFQSWSLSSSILTPNTILRSNRQHNLLEQVRACLLVARTTLSTTRRFKRMSSQGFHATKIASPLCSRTPPKPRSPNRRRKYPDSGLERRNPDQRTLRRLLGTHILDA